MLGRHERAFGARVRSRRSTMFHSHESLEGFTRDRVAQRHREARQHDQLRLARGDTGPNRFARLVLRLVELVRGTPRHVTSGDEAPSEGLCEIACPERIAGTCRCAQLGRAA
jgi:hypothetical protein